MTKLGFHSIEGAGDDKNLKEEKKLETFPQLTQSNPLHISQPELDELSAFTDSFLDFDFIDNWLGEENRGISGNLNMADLGGNRDSLVLPEGGEAAVDGVCKNGEENLRENKEPLLCLGAVKENTIDGSISNGGEMVAENANVESGLRVVGSDRESRDLSSFVEERLGRVSLNGVSNVERLDSHGNNLVSHVAESSVLHNTVGNNGASLISEASRDGDNIENDSDEESESESSSSSSSASTSSESEGEREDSKAIIRGKKVKNKEAAIDKTSDIEEGEIMLSDDAEEMVAWSDDEDGDENAVCGPIRSVNEIQVLPPVPSVNVALQPHHQTQPVGTIFSMIGAQVIVEGVEKHDPLNEGSILWITETRVPLGIVDEIFGQVKNPYYIVRYNSESEVPSDVQQGTAISYVREFASHVLGNENLYKKGYDASNEYDEELSEDDEFSDDEKEAEHRKMLKMKKRGTGESNFGPNRRNNQNKKWYQNHDCKGRTSQDQELCSSSSSKNHMGNGPTFAQAPRQAQTHSSSSALLSNGNWPMPIGVNLPSGPHAMLGMQQNPSFPSYQAPTQTNTMFPGMPMNFNPQLNFGNFSPTIQPWTQGIGPNLVNLLQLQIGLQALGGGGQNSQNAQSSAEILPTNFDKGRGGGRRGGGMQHRGRGRGRAWNHR